MTSTFTGGIQRKNTKQKGRSDENVENRSRSNAVKYVVVKGVAVPAVLASSFNDPDPSKRPFSYTHPLPPCAQAAAAAGGEEEQEQEEEEEEEAVPVGPSSRASLVASAPSRPCRVTHFFIPQVLPIVAEKEMPSNIQYNTPMPIYSREAAEEQYKQQVGAGPDHALGARDRHFDPEKSETLKAIKAGEPDNFGRHFNEQIAQAETPHVPPAQEPYWAHTARNRSERARSATPSATHATFSTQPYYAPHYSTLQHPKKSGEQRSHSASKRGYEFGGLDYVDKSRIPQDPPYVYYGDTHRYREEHRTTPGYEMGGMDFRKGAVRFDGPYHGHGPEQRRLQPKFEPASLKHDEMNIEIAPNVDHVSADVLIGDTRSNQHLAKDERPDNSFGTSFGPPAGFTPRHRAVNRQNEALRPTTFSLSAKKDDSAHRSSSSTRTYATAPPPIATTLPPPTDLAGYTSQTVTNYASHSTSDTRTDNGVHTSTVGGIGLGVTNAPHKKTENTWTRSQSAAPMEKYEWANDDAAKEKYDNEPTWSRIVSNRRNTWEEKARNTDARIQLPPSSKIPPQQPPYWYNKANQTHTLWQSEADRQSRSGVGYGNTTQTSYDYTGYRGGDQRSRVEHSTQKRHEYDTDARPTGNYDSFISQTQYKTHAGGGSGTESAQKNQAPYHTSYSSSQQQHHTTEYGRPPAESTYAAVPVGLQHPVSSNTQQPSSTWQSQSSTSLYERKMHERSTERVVSEQPPVADSIALPAPNQTGAYAIEKTSYQRKTHHETAAPFSASVVSVTQGGGDFNRRAEMAEVLPKGTVANTEASTEGNYVDNMGRPVTYKRELVTSVNPNSESTLLKEEERRVVETPLEPGVISRHVTTKYYKKKTVTDTTTTSTTLQ